MVWGDTLNFSITKFTKGPRILNMVMTFVLTPWSHYNTIIEPCVRFLLSLLEDLSIDFPSYMIISMIDIETLLHVISLSFLHLLLAFSHTCMSPFLLLLSFTAWMPLARNIVGWVTRNWQLSGHVWSLLPLSMMGLFFVLLRMLPMLLYPVLHLLYPLLLK